VRPQPPVEPPVVPIPPKPETPDPPKADPPEIDYDKLAEVIVEKYLDKIRGPEGKVGPPGPGITLDEEAVSEIMRLLPPVMLELHYDFDGDGTIQEDEVLRQAQPLGQPLRIGFKGHAKDLEKSEK